MSEKEISFWEHLEELRWTLFRTIIVLLVFTIVSFAFMPYIFDNIIMAPCHADFFLYKSLCKISSGLSILPDFCNDDYHVHIINIKLASQFFTHMSTSFWLAVVLACPYLIYEIWKFISPALYEHEKRNMRWAFAFGTVMFFIGCFVGYMFVFPLTLRFLATYQLSESILNEISLDSYMDNFIMLIFIMGIIFEFPLVSLLLSKLGLLTKAFFKKYRRYAIVILLVLAAIITPSGDPFTLSVVFLPLYMLYELSALFVKPGEPESVAEK